MLASAAGQTPPEIARNLRCASQTVRNAIHDLEMRGLACLKRGSSVPISVQPVLTAEKRERLREILHQSPRHFGKDSSVWTLKLLAEVCHEQGLSDWELSPPTILDAIVRLGVSWKQAKRWIVSPDPAYELKKAQRDRLIELAKGRSDVVLGYADEVWWSRETQPQMHAWSEEEPLRLIEQKVPADDPEGKASRRQCLRLRAICA